MAARQERVGIVAQLDLEPLKRLKSNISRASSYGQRLSLLCVDPDSNKECLTHI